MNFNELIIENQTGTNGVGKNLVCCVSQRSESNIGMAKERNYYHAPYCLMVVVLKYGQFCAHIILLSPRAKY